MTGPPLRPLKGPTLRGAAAAIRAPVVGAGLRRLSAEVLALRRLRAARIPADTPPHVPGRPTPVSGGHHGSHGAGRR